MAAHHRVHDYACCHLQADCLESGISSGPLCSIYTNMGTFTLYCHLISTWYFCHSDSMKCFCSIFVMEFNLMGTFSNINNYNMLLNVDCSDARNCKFSHISAYARDVLFPN